MSKAIENARRQAYKLGFWRGYAIAFGTVVILDAIVTYAIKLLS